MIITSPPRDNLKDMGHYLEVQNLECSQPGTSRVKRHIFWSCHLLFLLSFVSATCRHPVVLPHQGEVRGCVLQGPSGRILQNSPGNQVWHSLPEGLRAAWFFPADLPVKQTVVGQGHLQAWVARPHVGASGPIGAKVLLLWDSGIFTECFVVFDEKNSPCEQKPCVRS